MLKTAQTKERQKFQVKIFELWKKRRASFAFVDCTRFIREGNPKTGFGLFYTYYQRILKQLLPDVNNKWKLKRKPGRPGYCSKKVRFPDNSNYHHVVKNSESVVKNDGAKLVQAYLLPPKIVNTKWTPLWLYGSLFVIKVLCERFLS